MTPGTGLVPDSRAVSMSCEVGSIPTRSVIFLEKENEVPCYQNSEMVICIPKITKTSTRMHYCPNCKGRRKFFGWFQDWYGWHLTCLKCGDQWQDGEMIERPFMPAWREKNIARARKMLAEHK